MTVCLDVLLDLARTGDITGRGEKSTATWNRIEDLVAGTYARINSMLGALDDWGAMVSLDTPQASVRSILEDFKAKIEAEAWAELEAEA